MMKLTAVLTVLTLAAACSGDKTPEKILAKVGSEKITETQLNKRLAEINPSAREYLETGEGRKQLLEILVNEKLLELAAKRSPVASSESYKERVDSMEKELTDRLEDYKTYTLTRMWAESLRAGELKVTSEEIEAYLKEHPYKVVLDHMVLPSAEEAGELFKKLKAGADFAKIARAKSMDPDNVRLPPVMYGEFIPELEDMAFKMKVGETQGVVQTSMGYHILRKVSQTKVSGEEAEERAKRIIEKGKFDSYLEKFREKIKVEVFDETAD